MRQLAITIKTPGERNARGEVQEWTAISPVLRGTVAKAVKQVKERTEADYVEADMVIYVRFKVTPAMTSLLSGDDIRVSVDGTPYKVIKTKRLTPPKVKWVGVWLEEASDG
jgi:hypothetical protein